MITIAVTQGLFYILTGLWPFVSLRSFVAVTGPKTDIWLVKTVGALIIVIGVALCAGAMEQTSASTLWLGLLSALALATVDIYYSSRGVIRKIYLLDAVVEAVFVGAWIWSGIVFYGMDGAWLC